MQNDDQARKPVRFKLKKEAVRELGFEELASVAGARADATFSCCAACNTDGSSTWCNTKLGCQLPPPSTNC